MSLTKEKRVRMFLAVDGKCEYCGRDMVLSLGNRNYHGEDLATFDHHYNKDHEMRNVRGAHGEKRISLVCLKCNNDRARIEPNNNIPGSSEKTLNKIVPKEKWGEEKYMDRIRAVLAEEAQFNRRIAKIEGEIKKLLEEKRSIGVKVAKKVRYRNLLVENLKENGYDAQLSTVESLLNNEPTVHASVATDDAICSSADHQNK